jgi:hypothetical protein
MSNKKTGTIVLAISSRLQSSTAIAVKKVQALNSLITFLKSFNLRFLTHQSVSPSIACGD